MGVPGGARAAAQLYTFSHIILVFKVHLEKVLWNWPLQPPWLKNNLKIARFVWKKILEQNYMATTYVHTI